MASKPPKVSVNAFSAAFGSAAAPAGSLTEADANQISGPWRSLATVIGVSGPQYVTHTQQTLRSLKRYGG